MKMHVPLTLRALISTVALALLTACAGHPPAEPSANTKLNECSKIADRHERERCIDAAHRAD